MYMNKTKHKGHGLRNAVIVIVAVVAVIFLGNMAMNKLVHTSYSDLNSRDQEMLSQLNSLYSATAGNNEMWQGYDLNKSPIVFVAKGDHLNFKDESINLIRGTAYAVNVKGLENKAYAQKITMPKGYRLQNVYRLSAVTPGILKTWSPLGNFSSISDNMSLGTSKHVFYFKYNKKVLNNAAKTDYYLLPLLSHEFFHYDMQQNWSTDEPVSYEEESAQWYSLLGLRYKVMDRLLAGATHGTFTSTDENISDYVRVTAALKAASPKMFRKLMNIETAEGTAQYMSTLASRVAKSPDYTFISDGRSDKTNFSWCFSYMSTHIDRVADIRWLCYDVGAGICFTLNDAEGSTDWQKALNSREYKTLNDAVTAYYDSNIGAARYDSLSEIKAKYGFPTIQKEAKTIYSKLN